VCAEQCVLVGVRAGDRAGHTGTPYRSYGSRAFVARTDTGRVHNVEGHRQRLLVMSAARGLATTAAGLRLLLAAAVITAVTSCANTQRPGPATAPHGLTYPSGTGSTVSGGSPTLAPINEWEFKPAPASALDASVVSSAAAIKTAESAMGENSAPITALVYFTDRVYGVGANGDAKPAYVHVLAWVVQFDNVPIGVSHPSKVPPPGGPPVRGTAQVMIDAHTGAYLLAGDESTPTNSNTASKSS
jgi:hypothetical protein